jgi:hypothetical protein
LNDFLIFQVSITINTVKGIYDGITTAQLDEHTANYASTRSIEHPDFGVLAGRIVVSNLQKQTTKVFSEAMTQLYENVDPTTKEPKPLISKKFYDIVMENKEASYS